MLVKGPLISIIIPARNEKKNIGRLVKSALTQSYNNVEIIVVDDESADNTVALAKKAGARVYTRPHAERSVQRNFGASKSKGKYLLFLDADMELTPNVLKDCLRTIKELKVKVLVLPEKTVGEGFLTRVRIFEREMYMGDSSIEVARFFERRVFFEFDGYDTKLTGPEDYDLPYRIGKKHKIGRSNEYVLHHEGSTTLSKLLRRKYYYAKKGAYYADKHPELIKTQGNLLFRAAYIKNYQKFLKQPIIGLSFIVIRFLEMVSAVLGFISAVGIRKFIKICVNL